MQSKLDLQRKQQDGFHIAWDLLWESLFITRMHLSQDRKLFVNLDGSIARCVYQGRKLQFDILDINLALITVWHATRTVLHTRGNLKTKGDRIRHQCLSPRTRFSKNQRFYESANSRYLEAKTRNFHNRQRMIRLRRKTKNQRIKGWNPRRMYFWPTLLLSHTNSAS